MSWRSTEEQGTTCPNLCPRSLKKIYYLDICHCKVSNFETRYYKVHSLNYSIEKYTLFKICHYKLFNTVMPIPIFLLPPPLLPHPLSLRHLPWLSPLHGQRGWQQQGPNLLIRSFSHKSLAPVGLIMPHHHIIILLELLSRKEVFVMAHRLPELLSSLTMAHHLPELQLCAAAPHGPLPL